MFEGNLLKCNNDLILLHSRFKNGTNTTCNNGTILGQSFTVNLSSECYTSSLCIIFSPDMVGKPIRCVHDNGTATKEIGTLLIEPMQHHTMPITIITTLIGKFIIHLGLFT